MNGEENPHNELKLSPKKKIKFFSRPFKKIQKETLIGIERRGSDTFSSLVLKNVEDLKATLSVESFIKDCTDYQPSTDGSTGLPLFCFQNYSSSGKSSTKVSIPVPVPIVITSSALQKQFAGSFPCKNMADASSTSENPVELSSFLYKDSETSSVGQDTQTTSSSVQCSVVSSFTNAELPVIRLDNPQSTLKSGPATKSAPPMDFNTSELTWSNQKIKDCFVPTIDYLQVPPNHRASFRNDIHPARVWNNKSVDAANCVIQIPQNQNETLISDVNLPCYKRRPSGVALDDNFDYSFGVMYGRYTRDLGDYAKEEAKKLKQGERDSSVVREYKGHVHNKCYSMLLTIWKHTFARVGEDWVFLAVLGTLMAFVSFLMDFGIGICNKARIWLYRDIANSNMFLQYISWVSLPVCLILFSAGFVHLTAPQAVGSGMPEMIAMLKGSGIPEMKTILRGVVLKEYLTFKTLVAKIIGLTATLGTGLPLGKEGPFVHIASIVATLLSKAVTSFKGIYENESRHSEMLAAACAVGVACSFAAPIGGVLFSIEVTSVYFAVRNYWRGFFAAVCGAMMFRLLAVWFNDEETLTALFKTNFQEYPFDPAELVVYALTGVACGFLGAFFVWVHRQYVMFMRRNKKMKAFLQKSRFLYPVVATLIILSISFPPFLGQFMASHLTTHHQVVELFSNITWTKSDPTAHEFEVIENWRTPWTNVFVNLIIYIIFTFCGSVVASTLPVPSGIFIPVFKMGAALGRIVGESMAIMFPSGLSYGGIQHVIIPGGYSIVGAAAFAGAVTHTISTSVIVFELTGQITHILPVMIAVLIANGIAQLLQPSVYDSIIKIKKLPYLPDILTSTSGAYNMYVEDFMVRDVKYIWYGIQYKDLKKILVDNRKIRSLPLVDSHESMVLLGSIQRSELITLIEDHLGKDRRSKIVNKWKLAADKVLSIGSSGKDEELTMFEKGILSAALPDIGMAVIAATGIQPAAVGKVQVGEDGLVIDNEPNACYILSYLPLDPSPSRFLRGFPSMDSLKVSSLDRKKSDGSILTHAQRPSSFPSPLISISTPQEPSSELKPADVPDLEKRRSSRFAVTKVETPSNRNDSTVTLQVDPVEVGGRDSFSSMKRTSFNFDTEITINTEPPDYTQTLTRNTVPRKSILKKTRSFILHPTLDSPLISPGRTPYATVHGGDSKFRQAIENVIRKRTLSKLEVRSVPKINVTPPVPQASAQSSHISPQMLLEKTMEQQKKWEEEELEKKVEFSNCHIDPAPFQLVERTSLLKVHSLFSMLGLNHAYVTAIGRLIGVVALKELRKAIEEANLGDFRKSEAEDAEKNSRTDSPTSSARSNLSSQ